MNAEGEKYGWNSTSFETFGSWEARNRIKSVDTDRDSAREYLMSHVNNVAGTEALKKLEKMLL